MREEYVEGERIPQISPLRYPRFPVEAGGSEEVMRLSFKESRNTWLL
jgi:hypothetical protein